MLMVVLFFLAHTVGVATSHTKKDGSVMEALFWMTILTIYHFITLSKQTSITLSLGMNRH